MFSFHVDGLDRLEVSFLQLQALDDDQIWDIIAPAAELLKTRMQDVILRLFRQRSGSLHDSIEIRRNKHTGSQGGGVYATIGPDQKKHPGSSTGKRKSRHSPSKSGGGGGHYAGTNAEVGWILEYGSARIPARHWMETACTEAEEEIYQTLEAGWDETVAAAGL